MFLYAKIIFSCLDLLSDIREVRHELRVLPKNLNDAYVPLTALFVMSDS